MFSSKIYNKEAFCFSKKYFQRYKFVTHFARVTQYIKTYHDYNNKFVSFG